MEYTYEFLRKCHGLRCRATIYDEFQEGVIKVMTDRVMLCYGEEYPGYLVTFGRRDTLSFSEQTFSILLKDFEIVPRVPETYKDWQIGDKICRNGVVYIVIFRCGELVLYKDENESCGSPYTCKELFVQGYRLVLTDIEKQVIEEKQKAEWEPQDGDVCYLENNNIWIFVKKKYDTSFDNAFYVSYCLERDRIYYDGNIMNGKPLELRPATDEEKQRLFDALAKKGKRWNAETKVVENIEPERNEPVDVQKMIADALEGYVPKGSIEGFPLEVVAKMLERQYEQSGKIDLSDFERNRLSVAPLGFYWTKTEEGTEFWKSVICCRDFSEFFERYPKDASTGDSHTFREGEPVLVRDNQENAWALLAFVNTCEDTKYHYEATDGFSKSVWRSCIPYNEKTMHLLGTTNDYKEEQP